jgi:hypothetical protein
VRQIYASICGKVMGIGTRNFEKMPLFAHSLARMRMSRPAARLSVIVSGWIQHLHLDDYGPNTFRLLKNGASPKQVSMRSTIRKELNEQTYTYHCYLSNAAMLTMASNSLNTSG